MKTREDTRNLLLKIRGNSAKIRGNSEQIRNKFGEIQNKYIGIIKPIESAGNK